MNLKIFHKQQLITGQRNYVMSVSFNSQGLLANGSVDGTLKIWNVATLECIFNSSIVTVLF